jgi:hypothetical protein
MRFSCLFIAIMCELRELSSAGGPQPIDQGTIVHQRHKIQTIRVDKVTVI